MNIIKFVSKLFILVLFMISCEEESTRSSNEAVDVNTLEDSSLGLDEGVFSDYFYNLGSDFNAKFFYYQKDGPVANTVLNPGLLNPARDTLNLRTFSDFILKVEPQDLSSQTSVSVFDETIDGCSVISDACPDIDGDGTISNTNIVQDIPQVDSLIIYSHQFSSILKLEWDMDDNRYKPVLEEYEYENGSSDYTSQWLQDLDTIYVDDSIYQYDSLIYMTTLDINLTSPVGQFYFDQSVYIKRDSVYTVSDIELSKTFNFTRNILASDSVMYRVNTDCNLDGVRSTAENKLIDYNSDGDMIDVVYEFNDINSNGILEDGENTIFDYNDDGDMNDILFEFEDLGNDIIDVAEVFWDSDSDGERDPFEPFEDLNCNGVWDEAEEFIDLLDGEFCGGIFQTDGCGDLFEELDGVDGYDPASIDIFDPSNPSHDVVGNGQWDVGEEFTDLGNKIWDDAEYWDDQPDEDGNYNGIWDANEKLSRFNDAAVNLLVDYTDPTSPQAVSSILTTTVVKLRGDSENHTPIISEDIVDVVTKTIPEIDSVRTTFSNKVISQITDSTLFDRDFKILKAQYPNKSSSKNYNYNILDDSDNEVVQLYYPSYFLPYGFYTQPSQITDGFWYEDFLVLEPVFYTHNGNIREGEHVLFDSVYVTSHGDYHVETDYLVEKPASVIVPMKRLLIDENSNTCLITSTNPYPSCIEGLDISSFDSTLTDCYSIIKTVKMTMLGSGVEFGQRTTTTLAKDLGVVKEDVEIRWSEQIGIDGQVWSDYSSIALNDLRVDSELARTQGILNNLIGHTKINIKELNQLDGDPFIKGRSTGIQPVKLPSN